MIKRFTETYHQLMLILQKRKMYFYHAVNISEMYMGKKH